MFCKYLLVFGCLKPNITVHLFLFLWEHCGKSDLNLAADDVCSEFPNHTGVFISMKELKVLLIRNKKENYFVMNHSHNIFFPSFHPSSIAPLLFVGKRVISLSTNMLKFFRSFKMETNRFGAVAQTHSL